MQFGKRIARYFVFSYSDYRHLQLGVDLSAATAQLWERSGSCRCAYAALENRFQPPVITRHRVDVRRYPRYVFYQPPVHREPRIYDDLFKQDPLCPAIAFAKRVDDVEVAINFSDLSHQFSLGAPTNQFASSICRIIFSASGRIRSGVQNSVSPFWILTLRSSPAQS